MDTGISQGSPAALVFFITYLSGIFDYGKTEAAIFRRKKTPHAVKVGTSTIPFNKEATHWLSVWIDSQLTLGSHHAIRLKNGRNAMAQLRRLTRQMGLSPANCRKEMTACIQSIAMFGSELWWKGDLTRAAGLEWSQDSGQRQPSWRTDSDGSCYDYLACHRVTRLGRRRRPRIVIGRRLTNLLAYSGRMENTVLLEESEALDAELLQEEEAEATARTHHVHGWVTAGRWNYRVLSGMEERAILGGYQDHMGYNQEDYGAECAAPARALETVVRRQTTPERSTTFTDAQAAIRRMASEEPDPSQMYARSKRESISQCCAGLGQTSSSRSDKGASGNEKADEWAKLAAEEPDARGAEAHVMPLLMSLAHLNREISEKKWAEVKQWARQDLQEEVQDVEQAEAGWHSCR